MLCDSMKKRYFRIKQRFKKELSGWGEYDVLNRFSPDIK